jgi:Phasin protein
VSDNPQSQFANLFNLALDNKDVRALARTQAESFWRAQTRLLDQYETLAQDLVDRRRQGTEAALTAAQRLCGCSDAVEANSVCNDWMVGSVERMIADSRAFGELSMRLFQEAMGSVQSGANELGNLRFGKTEEAPRAEAPTELRRTA